MTDGHASAASTRHIIQTPSAVETLAARPFLNEPDTGIDDALGQIPTHSLPNLTEIFGLPDFEWAARRHLDSASYAWYRNAAGGEWSYRNNLEVFGRINMKPRVLVDITNIKDSLPTTILGYNFSAPFFISPCAKASYANPNDAEDGLVKGAAAGDILYIIAAAKPKSSQVLFQQLYVTNNLTSTQAVMRRAEKAGYKALILTVEAPASGDRQRAHRFGWQLYKQLQNMTSIPIIPKGITSVEDARMALQAGAPAIFLSNHGGRQLDTSPSSLEAAIEIYQQAPEIFNQVEVYADGGVRYAVGMGRPFMYANMYGSRGVKQAIDIMKNEMALDAANLGVADLRKINASYMRWENNGWYS
ncbi:FMN-dependent alpha-hydroxy acid dehydrogenase [Zopfia rhizophila CBS 207.26]|uniref:FMN-dependent alpha-hydroxy acid dehydrogenase n=1 Tax=Zopfia rhizophila CBS 207.26 TaxID=1314779 RepID=A0A6A6DJB5_9PEZI|nr:FMN-dependent alpha-hydroxy acid dehydrogenase [Zopfia rhizophila CBS 207.26]